MSSEKQKLTRWVVKVGSQLVVSGGPILMRAWMQQIARLRSQHHIEVIWVTSGAIATASEHMSEKTKGRDSSTRTLAEKQALSAIGQPSLMDLYNLSLQAVGLKGAQILITYSDIEDPTRSTNLKNTLEKILEWQVVPILNENDAVATEEIRFGDNDSLSAKVAQAMKADRLVILTNVEGLQDPNAGNGQLVPMLEQVSDALLQQLKPAATSASGTGGIYSKLMAAKEASEKGIETWLLKGDIANILLAAAENKATGTCIGGKR